MAYPQSLRSHAISLGGSLLLAVCVRTLVVVVFWHNLAADPDAYARIAENLAQQGEFSLVAGRPTAFRPPLYPLLLALLAGPQGVSRAGVAVLHVVLGIVTVVGTHELARRWLNSDRAAFLAASLVACDPILLNQSTLVMTETLAVALAVVAFRAIDRCWQNGSWQTATKAGVSLALCTLCRPTFLPWVPLVLVWLAMVSRGTRRIPWRPLAGALIAFVAVMSPWWLRNYRQFQVPVWTTTHGGYTLWLANNDSFYDHLAGAHRHQVWTSTQLDESQAALERQWNFDEIAIDRAESALAWETVRRRPGMAIHSGLYRFAQFWNPLPHAVEGRPSAWTLRSAIACWYTVQLALAVLGLMAWWRSAGWSRWGPALMLGVVLSGIHTVYWSNARMRAPLVPVVAIAVALAIDGLVARRTPRRKSL